MKGAVNIAVAMMLSVSPPEAAALDNGLCVKPPMGYNSYMGKTPVKKIAEFFVSSGMINTGYEYVNSDEGWEEKNRDNTTGRIVPTTAFGGKDGIKGFVQSIHAMGLKLGLYGAASGVTCGGKPGQLYYEDIDAQTYADWGIDYLKSDNCASYALDSSVRFGAMRDALNRTGKPIVLSIEPFSVSPDPEQSVKVSNLWRIACDISSSWGPIINRADIADKWSPLAGPGGWNDPDMIQVKNPPALTLGENRIYFGLWSIMKAPLLLSSDLPSLVPEVIAIVNNTEVVAINQDALGVQARKLAVDGKILPWLVGLSSCGGRPDTFYNRGLENTGVDDSRRWMVTALAGKANGYSLKSPSTGRCLAAVVAGSDPDSGRDVGMVAPCNASDSKQQWDFAPGQPIKSKVDGLCLDSIAGTGALGLSKVCNGWTLGGVDGDRLTPATSSHHQCVQVFNYSGPNVGLGSCKPAGSGYRGPQNMQWTYTSATVQFKSASTSACCSSPSRPIPTQGLCLSRGHLAPTPAPAPTGRVVLLPCNASDPQQAFGFGKGLHSPSSVYHVATDLAIAIANNTLNGQTYGSDAFPVPSAAYGEVNLALVPRWDQDVCTSRDCQNYDNSQMWYYSPTEQLLRASTFVGSINHKNDGNGYHLTDKVPTYRHHCLSHVLSVQNEGTEAGDTEVWGGPLAAGDFVMAAVNRGDTAANISVEWTMLEVAEVTETTAFDVRDLWAKAAVFTAKAAGVVVEVPSHDIKIYRLTKSGH